MTNYELTYIIAPDRAEFEAQKVENNIHENITKRGGNLLSHDFWSKQQLAYPIKGHDFGYYATVVFAFPPEHLDEFVHDLQLMPEVIRHLLISLDKEKIKLTDLKKINPFTDKIITPDVPAKRAPLTSSAAKKAATPKKDEATRMKELDEKLEDILKEE